MNRLVLASASPRRRELLHQVGIPHIVFPSDIPEYRASGEGPEEFVCRLAEQKATAAQSAFLSNHHGVHGARYWFLAADTVVVVDDRVLEKARSHQEATSFLGMMQGRDHMVLSGFAMLCPDRDLREVGIERTRVTFAPLSEAEIEDYLRTEHWQDAAGAYKIQGRGAAFIAAVHGSFPNVMGLPIHRICSILRDNQFHIGK